MRLLDCLGGNSRGVPGYFDPAADINIFKAFGDYVVRLSQEWSAESDPLAISLLAAARLLSGDLMAAEVILDHLPASAVKLDHGASSCSVMPLYALSSALALPPDVSDTSRWTAGSAEQAALRAWLAKHREQLHWVEGTGTYQIR